MSIAMASFFQLKARGTTVAREVPGGLATFLTMAYILLANPGILAVAGVPADSALAATALSAALCSTLMGLAANVPLAMAPGMGLNAVVAFQLAGAMGSWQAAMGLVVVEGLLVLALVGVGVREAGDDGDPRRSAARHWRGHWSVHRVHRRGQRAAHCGPRRHPRRAVAVDALGAAIGGWFGASSATAYIESAAGVAEGARTGLHSVVVGGLFVAAAFLAPLAGSRRPPQPRPR